MLTFLTLFLNKLYTLEMFICIGRSISIGTWKRNVFISTCCKLFASSMWDLVTVRQQVFKSVLFVFINAQTFHVTGTTLWYQHWMFLYSAMMIQATTYLSEVLSEDQWNYYLPISFQIIYCKLWKWERLFHSKLHIQVIQICTEKNPYILHIGIYHKRLKTLSSVFLHICYIFPGIPQMGYI